MLERCRIWADEPVLTSTVELKTSLCLEWISLALCILPGHHPVTPITIMSIHSILTHYKEVTMTKVDIVIVPYKSWDHELLQHAQASSQIPIITFCTCNQTKCMKYTTHIVSKRKYHMQTSTISCFYPKNKIEPSVKI